MTEQDWENETIEVSEAQARDTLPAAPPTEPDNEAPTEPRCNCSTSLLELTGADLGRCNDCGRPL